MRNARRADVLLGEAAAAKAAGKMEAFHFLLERACAHLSGTGAKRVDAKPPR